MLTDDLLSQKFLCLSWQLKTVFVANPESKDRKSQTDAGNYCKSLPFRMTLHGRPIVARLIRRFYRDRLKSVHQV